MDSFPPNSKKKKDRSPDGISSSELGMDFCVLYLVSTVLGETFLRGKVSGEPGRVAVLSFFSFIPGVTLSPSV